MTTLLASQGWPSRLSIYDGYYLQSTLYRNTYPGLAWYVVVLMPSSKDIEFLGKDSPLYSAVIAMVTITMTFVTLGLLVTVWLRNLRLIKLTGPLFTIMIICGSYLLCIAALMLLSENNDVNCTVRPWLFNLAFTASFSPLLIKAWRVHLMFNVNPLSKNKVISPTVLVSYTAIFVLIDAVILAITLDISKKYGTKPEESLEVTSNGAYSNVIYCGYTRSVAFYASEFTYKGILILTACFLSFKIRAVAGTIAGSKSLFAIVYNVAFVTGVVLLINRSIKDITQIVFVQVAGICFCVVLTLGLLIIPTVYQLITVGDQVAADEVIEEVFKKKNSAVSAGVSSVTAAPWILIF